MGLILEYTAGQTPLDEEEKAGLRIASIATRSDLDQFEQQNIEEAILWTLSRKFKPELILSDTFIKEVHRRMLGNVWSWAGQFRKTEKNLGIAQWKISSALKYLLDDTLYWIMNQVFEPDEIAIRFKHRLVSIHCFANGNGRHSRLMADIIIDKVYRLPVFTWGARQPAKAGDARTSYLAALRAADRDEYALLITFARS